MAFITMPQGVNMERLTEDLKSVLTNCTGVSGQTVLENGSQVAAVEPNFEGIPTADQMIAAVQICKDHNPALLSTAQQAAAAAAEQARTLKGELLQIVLTLQGLKPGQPAMNDDLILLIPIIQAILGLVP